MHQHQLTACVVLILFFCSAICLGAYRAADLVLVDNGEPRAVIVTADEPSDDAKQAASVLQQVVRQMSGATLPVETVTQFKGDGIAILVGDSTLVREKGIAIEQDRDAVGDHYVVRTGPDFVALAGNDHLELMGTVYAAYDLLQRLGCGWFGPDPVWHVIPEGKTLSVPPLDIDERPAFALRWIWFAAKHKHLKGAWRLGGRGVAVGDALNFLVLGEMPRDEYKKLHPGHFLGKARQPCLTNAEVHDLIAAKLRARLEQQKTNKLSMSVCQNDNDAFCPCDRCKAAGNVSAQMVHFANEIAARLDRTHPGRFELSFLAYWVVHSPPRPAIQPHPALSVMMVNEGDHIHPWDHAESADLVRRTERNNTREVRDFTGWHATDALNGIYEWWIPACDNANWASVPWYSGETHLKNLRYWKSHGIRDVYYETNFERNEGFPLRWPLYYVGARGLWDPQLTGDQIMTEACTTLFGPAAPHMLRFYGLIEKAMVDSELTGGNWNLPSPERIYTPEIEVQAASILDEAAAATTDTAILARIAQEQKMWEGARQTMARLREGEKQ